MRQRQFEIIRKPELEGSSFLLDNVPVRYVGSCPETGISFYCSNGNGEAVGVRVYPDGQKVLEKTSGVKYGKPYAHGKAEYLKFKHAFGGEKGILVSHAVYLAWSGKPILDGYQIHHLNGITTDNCFDNLFCVLFREHRAICDVRQKALKTVVPNADLNGFDYAILRELQNPRTMTDADFDARMEYLLFMYSCDFDPRIFNAADFHHFFSMPFEDFKSFFVKYKKQPSL